jgi:uncharacterized protein YkwD
VNRRSGWVGFALLLALGACEKEIEDDLSPSEASGSAGDGQEGPTLILPNGHPLNWLTDDGNVLAFEDEVLTLINARRMSLNLPALVMQVSHRRAARGHSRHMRLDVHAFFDHENPEGMSPGERLRANGVHWNHTAENIASGQLTPAQVVADWINSPGHRENIDDPRYRRTGIGYQLGASGGDYPSYWTQVFTD